MTPAAISRARALCEAVPNPPWFVRGLAGRTVVTKEGGLVADCLIDRDGDGRARAEFIASARTLLPEALDEVERLRAVVAEQRDMIADLLRPPRQQAHDQ